MKTLVLNGTPRTDISKQEVKSLREGERVPCVLYGGDAPVHFSAADLDFRDLIYTPEVHMVKLNVDGKEFDAVVKDVQYHPITDKLQHVDFLQAFPDKEITMSIPVRTSGASEGVKQGGKLVIKLRRLSVKALPSKMPDNITVDISTLKIGGNVRVRDLVADGVTFLDSESNVIVTVRMTRNVATAEPASK
jgi:large subunit ribosomal protein L25